MSDSAAMKLAGRVALVTGAGTGIGRALALGLAAQGADVVVNYLDNEAEAGEVCAKIASTGRRAVAIQTDVSSVPQIREMFGRVRKEFGRLDILVNNAGITGWTEVFSVTEEKWDAVIGTNLKGTFFCSIEAARIMREQTRGGSIINVSSNVAELGVKNLAVYATSKGGIHALTRQLAVELAPHRIRVNTFAPGPTKVERNLRDDPDYDRTWGSMTPMNRAAEPEEMVGPCVFLACDDSSYMTGQVFFVDGGWTVTGRIPTSHMDAVSRKHGGNVVAQQRASLDPQPGVTVPQRIGEKE
jgi:NAD(P)-dependent dehydrogenase (short-subunit alcohol dehydrogenase family)